MESFKSAAMQIEFKNMLNSYEKDWQYYFLKRLVDITASVLGLIALSPVMFLVSIAIKLDSKGSVFFSQNRVGENGKIFKMYKFRSMRTDAESLLENLKHKNEMSGPMFKMKNDPRVTKIGAFIRKTSIDELPQLFNVLKGEMSLVGPRPNLPKEVEKFTSYQKNKLLAKPGLTCYWQVMGRNDIDFEQWIELDIKYIKERNLWVDLLLIIKTVKVLFGDKSAS